MESHLNKCQIWAGAKTTRGYGVKRLDGKPRYVHRIVYCQTNGLELSEIKGKEVRHKCDNPSWVNPLHLEIGTHLDNMMDRSIRGRGYATEETKEKMKIAQQKRYADKPVSKETRLKQSESHIGHKHTDKTKEKMAKSQTGRKATEETRAKLIAAWVIRKQKTGVHDARN